MSVKDKINEFLEKFSVGGGHNDVIEEKNVKEGQVWKTTYPESDIEEEVEILNINKHGLLEVEKSEGEVGNMSPENLDELVEDVGDLED